jgi:hypothetical protein
MTYRELLKAIQELHPDNLDNDVTILIEGDVEYFAAKGLGICDDGVLDDGHPFIIV